MNALPSAVPCCVNVDEFFAQSKVAIPVVHSAAAIEKICGMKYCATNSMILRVLLDKKYSLPYRVIDAVFRHFMRFMDETRRLPVLWHQCLLVYAQRYADVFF